MGIGYLIFLLHNLIFFYIDVIFLRVNLNLFIKLGEIGFTFLGVEIPHSLIKKFVIWKVAGFVGFKMS